MDLNRQFGVDFGQIDNKLNFKNPDDWGGMLAQTEDPCNLNFVGSQPFSEPETVAFKNFLTEHKKELAFVLNVHSNGNAFIYPFNGREKNDID